MAIQGDYNFNGIPVTGAIGVVMGLQVRSRSEMFFQLPIYANEAQYSASQPLAAPSYFCGYDPEGGDVFAQATTYLLTLPDYAGWAVIPVPAALE